MRTIIISARPWILLFLCVCIIYMLLIVNVHQNQYLLPVRENLPQNDAFGLRILNPHPFKYLHTSHEICSLGLHEKTNALFLLVLVKSAAEHFALRNAIRKTWGTFSKESKVQLRFLLGYDTEIQSQVKDEYAEYKDIIQEDFNDAYFNNTYKTIMGYNWVVQFCSNARYIFFVDDDMFVNIDNVIDYLEQVTPQEESILFSGMLATRPTPERGIQSKWFVRWEDYPWDFYPPYLGGGAILTSQIVVRQFQMVFPYVLFFKIDDVYLGLIAKKLSIQPTNNALLEPRTLRNMPNLPNMLANHGFDDPDFYMRTYAKIHKSKIEKSYKIG